MYSETGNTTAQMLHPKLKYSIVKINQSSSVQWTLTQHGPVKHKTNDKQPRQISTTGSKNWLLTSAFEAQNNEPDHTILQEKINSKYNYKFTGVNEQQSAT
jgi:hypothetical protein